MSVTLDSMPKRKPLLEDDALSDIAGTIVPGGEPSEVSFPASLKRKIEQEVGWHPMGGKPLTAQGRLAAWRAYTRYLRYAMESLLWIKTQEGLLVPFRLNNLQRRALAQIAWQLFIARKPVRWVWLKFRREGASTFVCALFFILTRYQPHTSALIMANSADRTKMVFDICKLFEAQINVRYRRGHFNHIPQNRSNMQILNWYDFNPEMNLFIKEGGSLIRIVSGLSSKGAVGEAFHRILYDEVGDDRVDWDGQTTANDRGVKMGMIDTVIMRVGTTYLDETSKRAMTGAYLQEAWEKAGTGESGFTQHFDAWWEADWYRLPLEPGESVPTFGVTPEVQARERDEVEKLTGLMWDKWRIDKASEPQKGDLIRQVNEALKWRCAMLKEMEGKIDWFHSQYPSYPEQAFISRVGSYFAGAEINTRLEHNQKSPSLRRTEGDRLTVFFDPEPETDYLITADPSPGTGDNEQAAIVFNTKKLEDVAVWHGRVDIATQAQEWAALGYRYATQKLDVFTKSLVDIKPALLAIEENQCGVAIQDILRKDLKYPHLWRRRYIQRRHKDVGVKYGFSTDASSRGEALAQLAVQWQTWGIHDNRILRQMANFGYKASGKPAALIGGDEFVTCYWIRAIVCRLNHWIREQTWEELWVEPKDIQPQDPSAILDFLHQQYEIAVKEADQTKIAELSAKIKELSRRIEAEILRKEPWWGFQRGSQGQDWRLRGFRRKVFRIREENIIRP